MCILLKAYIYFCTGGPIYNFPFFSIICFDIFFSFFCPIWSWKMIQNCGLISDHSRCHSLMFDYVWVEPGVLFCRRGRGSETAYTFHLMTTFHNTLGEGSHFLFYFKIFYSFYILIMIYFLISIIALNFIHSSFSFFTLS